jgi:hypothetical protein
VLERLVQVLRANLVAAREIRDRPGDAGRAMEAPQ